MELGWIAAPVGFVEEGENGGGAGGIAQDGQKDGGGIAAEA